MNLPIFIEAHATCQDCHYCSFEECALITALSIAWEAMAQARHWNNVRGLSSEGALAQVEIDLSQAIRRIESLGDSQPKELGK